MASFDLSQYETVDSRIKRFYADNPTGRIVTFLHPPEGEVGKTRWIVRAEIWRAPFYDRDMTLPAVEPDGTGYAFENDGEGMANKTSALENCETSAIGRALANIGYSGDKRASREEMTKARPDAETPDSEATANEWIEVIEGATSESQLKAAWEGAGKAGVQGQVKVIAAKDAKKKDLGL